MLTRCPNCGAGRLKRRPVDRTRHVAGHRFSARLAAQVCGSCGETYFDDATVASFDLAVAARLADAGVTSADALKFMRKVTGLQGKEFAALLHVRPETVSRWEQAKRPIDRATYAIIRQLISERMRGSTGMVDYLRSLQKPKRLPKVVKLGMAAA